LVSSEETGWEDYSRCIFRVPFEDRSEELFIVMFFHFAYSKQVIFSTLSLVLIFFPSATAF